VGNAFASAAKQKQAFFQQILRICRTGASDPAGWGVELAAREGPKPPGQQPVRAVRVV